MMVGCASTYTPPPRYVIGNGGWSHEVICDEGKYYVTLKNGKKSTTEDERDKACVDFLPQAQKAEASKPKIHLRIMIQPPQPPIIHYPPPPNQRWWCTPVWGCR